MKMNLILLAILTLLAISFGAYQNRSTLSVSSPYSVNITSNELVESVKSEKQKNEMLKAQKVPIVVKLGPTANISEGCIKTGPCELRVTIQNIEKNDLEIAELNFILRPQSSDSKIDFRDQINSLVDLSNMETLTEGLPATKIQLNANGTLERYCDLTKLGWAKSISSTLQYKELWNHISEGTFELFAEVGYSMPSDFNVERPAKIGNTQVIFTDNYFAKSEPLKIEIKR